MRWVVVAVAACSGGTPSSKIDGPAGQGGFDSIQFSTSPIGFDDLRFAPDLGKVVAIPFGGNLYLVDPVTNAFTHVSVPSGCATGDGKGSTVYLGDRNTDTIAIVDAVAGAMTGTAALQSAPDYVRVSPTTNEVWVTLPGSGSIDYYAINAGMPVTLTRTGGISISDPEGLEFDGAGHAYTNGNGAVVQIDVATHAILQTWPDGCSGSHGFPQSDTTFGLAFGGCAVNGGAGVVSTASGSKVAFVQTDGGPAILAYDQTLHHLYLRGDGGPTFAIYGVSSSGSLTQLQTVAIPSQGHGATADQDGHAWVCDPQHGGIIKITDTAHS